MTAISTKKISRALRFRDKSALPPLVVLRTHSKNLVTGDILPEWVIATGPATGDTLDVSARTAEALIDLCGLVPAASNRYGTVYDTADRDFLARHRGEGYMVRTR